MKTKTGLLAAGLLLLLCVPARINADSLTGQTITTTYLYPNTTTVYAGPTATVVPGDIVDFAAFATITFSANNILITADRNGGPNFVTFDGFEFSDPSGIFSSVTLDSSSTYAGLDASDISFTADSIFVNVAGLTGLTGQTILLDINAGSTPAPEPASALLLVTGFLGLIGARKRRQLH